MNLRKLTPILIAPLVLAGCMMPMRDDPARSVRGVSSRDAEELNASRSQFDSAQDPPLRAQTHFAAGQLAETQNALPQAIEQYRAAVKLDPDHRPSRFRLSVLLTQTRQFDAAIESWKQYIQQTDGEAGAFANLGYCHELAGQNALAEAAYQQGIARDPNNNPCRVNFGLLLARLGRTNEAIIHLQAVLPPAQVHYNLASIHQLQGRKDQARAEYRKALELDPTLNDAKSRLASLD